MIKCPKLSTKYPWFRFTLCSIWLFSWLIKNRVQAPISEPTCACPAGNGTSFRSNCLDVRFTRQNDTATDIYVKERTSKVWNMYIHVLKYVNLIMGIFSCEIIWWKFVGKYIVCKLSCWIVKIEIRLTRFLSWLFGRVFDFVLRMNFHDKTMVSSNWVYFKSLLSWNIVCSWPLQTLKVWYHQHEFRTVQNLTISGFGSGGRLMI